MSLSYTVPKAVVAPTTPPVPSQDESRLSNPRTTLHSDTVALMDLIISETGMTETKALGLVVSLSNSDAIKRMQTGGYDNPGRSANVVKSSLTLAAITAHLNRKYPNLQCSDVFSQVQMLQAYYFCTSTDEAVKEQLYDAWDEDFSDKILELRTNLGDAFCASSGAGEVMDFILSKASVYADRSHSSRLIQIVLGADLTATMLQRIRENPACLDDLPQGLGPKLIKLLAKESSLTGIGYNVPSPITIEKVILLTAKSKAPQFVPADYTVIHLIHNHADGPAWDVLKNYELFAVANCPSGQSYPGYHAVGQKKMTGKHASAAAGEKPVEETCLATIFTRDSPDRLKHDLYLMAALADAVHTFLKVPVSKQSFSYRAGAAYRSEIQRILVRFELIPTGSVVPQPKSKGGKKKKSKTSSKSDGGSESSSRTDAGTTATLDVTENQDWGDDTIPATVQPENTSEQKMLLQEGLPGMALAAKHGINKVQASCADYVASVSAFARGSAASVVPTTQAARIDSVLKTDYGLLHSKIVKELHPTSSAKKISGIIDLCLRDITTPQQQHQQACKAVCRDVLKQTGQKFIPGLWELAMLRIICAVAIANIESKGIEPYVEGLVLKSRGHVSRAGNKGSIYGGGQGKRPGSGGRKHVPKKPEWAQKTFTN